MHRALTAALAALTLVSCRGYDYRANVTRDTGLVPGDQFARYGREQAQLVAIGRELARVGPDSTAQAVRYARALPDVVNVTADSLGTWLTVSFKSGWRAATNPIDDGKGPADTPGLPAGS